MGRWRTVRRWALRVTLGGAAVVLALAGIGWTWERSEEAAFRASSVVPPDTMVQVRGQMLRVVVSGQGGPGVLLLSGLGGGPDDWETVQARLSDSMRVVSYDRPGVGWSPPRDGDPTLDVAVADVADLLTVPGLFHEPPLLIGHSLGDQIARRVAYAHPGAISGLILIDPPPDEHGLLTRLEGTAHAVLALAAKVGLLRRQYYQSHPDVPRDQLRVRAHLRASSYQRDNVRREMRGFMRSPPADVPPSGLGDLPVTLVLADQPVAGFLRGRMDEFNAAKRVIARESTRSRLIEMQTGHYIQVDHPDTVIAEVWRMRALVDSLRTGIGRGSP